MPGAIAGEELDPTTYAFTTRSGPDEIERYMTTQMAKIGWHFLATGTGETGALVLFFTKGGSTASVSIIPVKDNQGTYFVLILLH